MHKSLEKELEKIRTKLKNEIANELDTLIKIEEVSDLSEEIIELNEDLEEVTNSYNRFKDKWFETVETPEALTNFHNEFEGSFKISIEEMNEGIIKELLEDIIVEIYAISKNQVHIVFKHPHIEEVGGVEVIEFK